MFIKAVQEVGLGVAMSGLVAIMFFYFLKQTMKRHTDDVQTFAKICEQKDVTLNNHIEHLTDATLTLKESFIVHDAKVESQTKQLDLVGDKIVEAIDNQSELMKEIARVNGGKQ